MPTCRNACACLLVNVPLDASPALPEPLYVSAVHDGICVLRREGCITVTVQ